MARMRIIVNTVTTILNTIVQLLFKLKVQELCCFLLLFKLTATTVYIQRELLVFMANVWFLVIQKNMQMTMQYLALGDRNWFCSDEQVCFSTHASLMTSYHITVNGVGSTVWYLVCFVLSFCMPSENFPVLPHIGNVTTLFASGSLLIIYLCPSIKF